MAKKRTFILYSLFAIGAILIAIYGGYVAESYFKDFYATSIAGKLTYVGVVNHATGFKVDNQHKTFTFTPYYNIEDNKPIIFLNVAAVGDSVIKPASADTLVLIHNNKRYYYTFQNNK